MHITFQAHLNFKPMSLTESKGHRIFSAMNMGDWWWDTEDQLPARATIVQVICASEKTHLTNVLGDEHSWLWYLTTGNVCTDLPQTLIKHIWILIRLILCPPQGAKNIDEAWHTAVGTVLSQLRHHDITGPGLKWDCVDGFQRQC